ncbi:MAG: hypothetical protein KJ593_02830 [Candidatus Omnitrophica bacterium]|nr:hypothetical protein [Candidatus Omnitrophota bacterium]
MDLRGMWDEALKNTEIIRPRVQDLQTFSTTHLPYVFLSKSSINAGDTVVRKGEVVVDKPSLILPSHSPQFGGFDFEKEFNLSQGILTNFLIIRGIKFPSLKYNNKTYSLDVYEGELEKAISYYRDKLQREEDVHTGLITAPEDYWQLSVLIFIFTQVVKSADTDIQKLLDDYRRRQKEKGNN